MPQQPCIEKAYFNVGRVFAKAIIEMVPIPARWTSDFLISFLIGEDIRYERMVPLPRLVRMLIEIDPMFKWMEAAIIRGDLVDCMKSELEPETWQPETWPENLRKFIVDQVSQPPEYTSTSREKDDISDISSGVVAICGSCGRGAYGSWRICMRASFSGIPSSTA